MAQTTFSGPIVSTNGFTGDTTGNVTGNVTGAITLPTYTVAGVPSAATNARMLIYVSNGAAGAPVVAFSNGTSWLRCDTLAAVAAA